MVHKLVDGIDPQTPHSSMVDTHQYQRVADIGMAVVARDTVVAQILDIAVPRTAVVRDMQFAAGEDKVVELGMEPAADMVADTALNRDFVEVELQISCKVTRKQS